MIYQDAAEYKLAMLAEQFRQNSLSDMDVLTEFVVHNAELEELEDKLRQFNIFEAVGMQWQEIRHSAFIAFLLAPQQAHGLGEDFLKKVIQRSLLSSRSASLPVNVVNLHLMNLDKTVVEREWNNIDILLLNHPHQLAVIIENKLQSGEHDNQLDRYFQMVQRQYPDWRILGLYLTIDGEQPSDSRYLPISYADIADIVGALVISRETVLGPDVRTLMHHYVQMLRRNIVSDAELDELCRQIYQKHKRALDLIVARIPDKQAIIHQALLKMVVETPGIRLRWHGRTGISFHPEEWDVPALQYAGGKDAPALIFQFYIYNTTDYVKMWLEIRKASEERRKPLFEMGIKYGKPFTSRSRRIGKNWNAVYSRYLVTRKQMPQLETTDVVAKAYEQFSIFVQNDLPAIQKALNAQDWVWTTQATDDTDSGGADDAQIEEEEDEQ